MKTYFNTLYGFFIIKMTFCVGLRALSTCLFGLPPSDSVSMSSIQNMPDAALQQGTVLTTGVGQLHFVSVFLNPEGNAAASVVCPLTCHIVSGAEHR